jgi:hypothetical protein
MKPNVLGLRQCDEAIAAIVAAERILDQNASPAGQSYQEVRNKLGAVAKELIIGISALLKDAQLGNFDLVGADSMQTADNITRLNEVTIQLAAVVPEAGVKPKLIGGGRAVTRATATMARNAKALTEDNKNATKIAQLSNSFNQTTEAIRLLMAGIKEGARGERDCEQALEEIKKLNVRTRSLRYITFCTLLLFVTVSWWWANREAHRVSWRQRLCSRARAS